MSEEFELVNSCKYSFKELVKAAGKSGDVLVLLYSMSQHERNAIIKELCYISGWHFKDIEVDGEMYTAFSPKITRKINE